MANTGKIAEVVFEQVLDTHEEQEMMLDKVDYISPDSANMQNAGNVIWRPVEQHAPIITGWDLTGQEQDIIEETYPAVLGTPKNDLIKQRADDVRDMQFWKRRGQVSGKRQASELNKAIAQAMVDQGSLYYDSAATSGYDFIGEAQAIMNEEQGTHTERCFLLNDRSNLSYAKDLAGRQTVQGRPDEVWTTGQVATNVAEFDVYTGSFLPNVPTGGALAPAVTVTGAQSFKPEGGTVDPTTLVVTNIDYRTADIPVSASAQFAVGDKITFANVEAVGREDKTTTGRLKTFTVVGIPDGTTITVYPKPIAADDVLLTDLEKAYANVNTTIAASAAVTRLNPSAKKANLFWDKDAVEVIGGNIPAEYFKQFDGMKLVTEKMKNGQEMYMLYDANLIDMTFRYRIFTWYGITIKDPQRVGVATGI